MIKEDFLKILEDYEIESKGYNKKLIERREKKVTGEIDPKSNLPKSSYITAVILTSKLPTEVRRIANLRNDFHIKGSAGNGFMPEIPHVCIFDKTITTSAERGYYIVYLFHSPTRRVYLSLNQGYTEYSNEYGNKDGKIKIRQNAILAQGELNSVDGFNIDPLPWDAKGNLAEGYRNGNICFKEYNSTNFPDDVEFVDDLRNLIGIYRELKGIVGPSMFNIRNIISESQYQEAIQSKEGLTLPNGPLQKKAILFTSSKKSVYPRDIRISSQAIMEASYRCENDNSHKTFTSHFGHPFVEAHHFIPLQFHDQFQYNLDVPENVLSLCPNCHRAFHHSEFSTKQELISKFWKSRQEKLDTRGIHVTEERLRSFYKILESQVKKTTIIE